MILEVVQKVGYEWTVDTPQEKNQPMREKESRIKNMIRLSEQCLEFRLRKRFQRGKQNFVLIFLMNQAG
jgi:hypothetical protein